MALAMCLFFTTAYTTEEKSVVLVSVAAYQGIVQEMAGSNVNVMSVVPSGMSFHTFEPTPHLARTLSSATLWFTIGETFENKIINALRSSGTIPVVVDLREGVTLLHTTEGHCCHEEIDTHMWTSPRTMRSQLSTIRNALVSSFPPMKEGIEERYLLLQQRIDMLISEMDTKLSGETGKIIVIAHAAYGYLCHDYGIDQRAIEVGGKEATPKRLHALIQEATSKGVKTLFSLKQYPRKGIDRIAEVLNAHVVELDAYQPDYFASMTSTAEAFHKALKEEKA
jgi:zinc transport system substrate-binding protein